MNLGVASWRNHLQGRIDEMITKYGVDAYFLDIAGGWINDTKADMHAGMRTMVTELRAKHPQVLACGEMHYDAMLEFIPLYHSGGGGKYARDYIQRHAKFFSHLSTPAPGRGSSGVHESGFGRFNTRDAPARTRRRSRRCSSSDDTFEQSARDGRRGHPEGARARGDLMLDDAARGGPQGQRRARRGAASRSTRSATPAPIDRATRPRGDQAERRARTRR